MGNFTFNLDSLKSSAGSAASFETSLNAKTKDEDLKYTGTDTIVWDRVNGERLRRGLPSLTSLGYPRPPESTTPAPAGSARGLTHSQPQQQMGQQKYLKLKDLQILLVSKHLKFLKSKRQLVD